jgi:membrane peptidoglycan carboxypeptidase
VNSVFARLILDVGADEVAKTARRMGITSEVEPVPAIALGGLKTGVAPIEMASAFGTLANGGVHVPPYGILEVKDASGEVLYTAEPAPEQVLDPAVAYLTTDILRGVVAKGTGTNARIGRPQAGKTGTTQQYRDAWFIGYTPDIVASVWVGYAVSQKEMLNVHGIKVIGGSFPARIWAAFAKKALKDVPPSDFKRPAGLISETICLESGQKAGEYCEKKGRGLFLAKHPPEPCELHTGPVEFDMPNLIGMMKADAIALLNGLKLRFTVDERPLTGVPAGMVGEQDPAFGSRATTATVVSLVVSTGPPKTEAPVAAFTYAPASPRIGEQVTFDASSSTDDGEIVTYAWEFGDGSPLANGVSAAHTYTAPGTYTVTLWVTDDTGQVASLSVAVQVK